MHSDRTLTTIAAVCCQSDEKSPSMRVGPAWKTGKVPLFRFRSLSLGPGRAAPPLHPQPCVLFGTISGFDSVGTLIAARPRNSRIQIEPPDKESPENRHATADGIVIVMRHPGVADSRVMVPPNCCTSSRVSREPRPSFASSGHPTPSSSTTSVSSVGVLRSFTQTVPAPSSGKACFKALVTNSFTIRPMRVAFWCWSRHGRRLPRRRWA
jgi:hypothetical protein